MIIGYARVSTLEQNTALQVAALQRAAVDEIHEEKLSAVKQRPVLDGLIEHLQDGDTLVVYKLDRLARSMSHFVRVFERLRAKNVGFRSLTEAVDTTTVQGRMFLNLLGVFAEFERELIKERCTAGIRNALTKRTTWGRTPMFTEQQSAEIAERWRAGELQDAIAADLNINVSVVRDHIHKAERRGRWARKPPFYLQRAG